MAYLVRKAILAFENLCMQPDIFFKLISCGWLNNKRYHHTVICNDQVPLSLLCFIASTNWHLENRAGFFNLLQDRSVPLYTKKKLMQKLSKVFSKCKSIKYFQTFMLVRFFESFSFKRKFIWKAVHKICDSSIQTTHMFLTFLHDASRGNLL